MSPSSTGTSSLHKEWGRGVEEHANPCPFLLQAAGHI
jgi:hypothetical protein